MKYQIRSIGRMELVEIYKQLSERHRNDMKNYLDNLEKLKQEQLDERDEILNIIYIDRFNKTYTELNEMFIQGNRFVKIDTIIIDINFVVDDYKIEIEITSLNCHGYEFTKNMIYTISDNKQRPYTKLSIDKSVSKEHFYHTDNIFDFKKINIIENKFKVENYNLYLLYKYEIDENCFAFEVTISKHIRGIMDVNTCKNVLAKYVQFLTKLK